MKLKTAKIIVASLTLSIATFPGGTQSLERFKHDTYELKEIQQLPSYIRPDTAFIRCYDTNAGFKQSQYGESQPRQFSLIACTELTKQDAMMIDDGNCFPLKPPISEVLLIGTANDIAKTDLSKIALLLGVDYFEYTTLQQN
ncbi:hypothetical protein HOD08_00600 [bacterium]|nr:hypothetical protein [bacterium]